MDWGDTSRHNTGKSIVAAEEQIALEDVNHLDDEEKGNETKEGVTDDLIQFLYPKYSENSKVGESCVLCGFASSATRKVTFSPPWRGIWKKAWKRRVEKLESFTGMKCDIDTLRYGKVNSNSLINDCML